MIKLLQAMMIKIAQAASPNVRFHDQAEVMWNNRHTFKDTNVNRTGSTDSAYSLIEINKADPMPGMA
jgi:hypothetical protein